MRPSNLWFQVAWVNHRQSSTHHHCSAVSIWTHIWRCSYLMELPSRRSNSFLLKCLSEEWRTQINDLVRDEITTLPLWVPLCIYQSQAALWKLVSFSPDSENFPRENIQLSHLRLIRILSLFRKRCSCYNWRTVIAGSYFDKQRQSRLVRRKIISITPLL